MDRPPPRRSLAATKPIVHRGTGTMTSSGELRALFSNARKLYVQGKFRQLLDLTAGVDGLSGQLKDNTLASGLRKLRWQAIARSNLEREEADRILAGTIQHPKDIAPDEVVHLLPALSPEQRRRVIKGFLAAQPPVFFDRVADRVEPENQLYTSLVEAYVLTSAPDSNDDTSEFLKVSLVGQEKKDVGTSGACLSAEVSTF